MTPDWDKLAEETPILAALVVGLAKRTRCDPEAVLEAVAELIEHHEQPATQLRVVSDDPQAAA